MAYFEPSNPTPPQQKFRFRSTAAVAAMVLSPCVVSGALALVGIQLSIEAVVIVALFTTTATAIVLWRLTRQAGRRGASEMAGRCVYCGYPVDTNANRGPCPECGCLPGEPKPRLPPIDLACGGCKRMLVELPTGNVCPHCSHELTFAQAVELSRRKAIRDA